MAKISMAPASPPALDIDLDLGDAELHPNPHGHGEASEQVRSMLHDVRNHVPTGPNQSGFVVGSQPLDRRQRKSTVAFERRRNRQVR